MKYAVEAEGLTRRFGDFTAVDNVSLHVEPGEIYGLLGLNGAGKSTMIKMFCTLLRPTEGVARVLGHPTTEDAFQVRDLVGLVGDEAGESHRGWTAREYVAYHAELRGCADPAAEAERVLEVAGLEQRHRGRVIGAFSTGMKRRAEIARALLGSPRVLFLDEPTRGLDLPGKMDVWDVIRELSEKERVTVFVSSHEVREIQSLCQRIGVLAEGRLSYAGSLQEFAGETQRLEDHLVKLLRGA